MPHEFTADDFADEPVPNLPVLPQRVQPPSYFTEPPRQGALTQPTVPMQLVRNPVTVPEGIYNSLTKTLAPLSSPAGIATAPLASVPAVQRPLLLAMAAMSAKGAGTTAGELAGTPGLTPGQKAEKVADIGTDVLGMAAPLAAVRRPLVSVPESIRGLAREPQFSFNVNVPENLKPKITEEISGFADELRNAKMGEFRGGTNKANDIGMKAKTLEDLEALANLRRDLRKTQTSHPDPDQRIMAGFTAQYPREAIETAANVGSNDTAMLTKLHGKDRLGERPLDWKTHPEVAEWLKFHGPALGIDLPEGLRNPQQGLMGEKE